jgi:cytochrome c-type biogenesis protein CcmH
VIRFSSAVRVLPAVALLLAAGRLSAQSADRVSPASPSTQSIPDSALEARTSALASELRCPVCQGNSLQDSPSEMAQEMRSLIRDQLRSGKTPGEVRAYFVDKYGEWILLAPKAQGLNLIVYLVPLAAVLVGGAVVWRTVRRWTVTARQAEARDDPSAGP